MITLRNVLPAICLVLMVVTSVSAGTPGVKPKPVLTALPSAPVVKIDRAMLEERQVLPDGTVSTETSYDSVSATTARAVKPAVSEVVRAKA